MTIISFALAALALQDQGTAGADSDPSRPLFRNARSSKLNSEAAMPDTIRKVDYYYITAPDKPGEGARVLGALRDAGVNLMAIHAFPSARRSQIDLVPTDAVAFLNAAKTAGLKVSKPKAVFLVEGDDRVGAMAQLLARLGAAGINVTATSAVRTGPGRYGALLWVKPRDVRKAAETLGVQGA